MNRTYVRACALCASALLMLAAGCGGARAETAEVRIATPFGIGFLPLTIMQHQKLLEARARSVGLGEVKVTWRKFAGGNVMNDALLSGDLDFASGGVPPFLTLWEKTKGSLQAKGVAALSALPMLLNTRDPKVKSIKDFADGDKIALAAVKVSGQALVLQMAAARMFGEKNYAQLDKLTVGMGQPDAMAALLSGAVTAHFASAPYSVMESKQPGIHTVLNSYDVYGAPTTEYMVWSTERFRGANPKVFAAFYAALLEAGQLIATDKKRAAEIYLAASGDKTTSVADLLQMLNDPQFQFSATPKNVMTMTGFMHRIDRLKTKPDSWKELFFPEAHALPGS
jgi:NitT/TauT family transport system substrate-binding protein